MSNIRISFNVSELKELIQCLVEKGENKKLHTKLSVALLKLGHTSTTGSNTDQTNATLSMNEKRKAAYELWLVAAPGTLSEQEEKNAKQYMYDNGLMTEEEAEQYESAMFDSMLD